MKKFVTMLMTVCFMVILLPITVSASVSDNDLYNYNAGDVAVIRKIIEASPTLSEKFDKNNPASWDNSFVGWSHDGTENRVVSLALYYSETDGESIAVTDFSGMMDVSKLTYLSFLNCSTNSGLTKLVLPESGSLDSLRCHGTGITVLDLSAQTNLTFLECYSCEGLAALDVSQNTKLTHLDFEETAVSSIDLSMLTELVTLWCSRTNITALDVSQNTNLENLYCNDTAIASLDLSNNPALSYLNCSNTNITALDISANTSLVEIYWPSFCPEIVTPEGYKITLQQTTGGTISLSAIDDGSGRVYTLRAFSELRYELIRFTGVTNMISDNGSEVSFTVTGDMTLSAEFATEKRLLLTALSIEGVQLSPAFAGNVYNYTASVEHDVSDINIFAQGEEGYELRIDGDGKHSLEDGENTFVVTLVVPFIPGLSDINNPNEVLTTDYTITVTCEEDSDSDSDSDPEPEPSPTPASELDDVPKTGDSSHVDLWFGLMMISIVTLIACAVMWSRNKRIR